ncbi:Isochorismatase hydrolase [Apiospora marii]|uniref:Isochorismatase hydrolase n=2 Tax=Apiospora marii TaxID=335849 RepID=A0ABR1S9G5_9PEZI
MSATNAYKPSAYPPSETALLLLDCQNVLVNMIQDPAQKEKFINSTKTLLDAARKNNVTIVHCLIDTTQDPPPANKATEHWATVHKPLLASMPDSGAEYADLSPKTGDGGGNSKETVSTRPPGYKSVLVADGLVPLLRDSHIKHLVLGGIATSGAVLGTVTHGTDLDFVVTAVEDACWDPNQVVHRALMDTVSPTQAWVAGVDEAVGYFSA